MVKSRRLRRLAVRADLFARRWAPQIRRRPRLREDGPRLIFTVTNGRSGSNYLATVLGCLDAVHATHEPAPYFQDLFRDVQFNQRLAQDFLLWRKLPAIASSEKPIYLESSHLFCKGYFDAMVALDRPFDLVILTRSAEHVAASMMRLGTVPGRTRLGRYFYLEPTDNVMTPLGAPETFSDLELCLWHAREIEARQRAYAEKARALGRRVVETSAEALNDFTEVERVAAALDAPITAKDRVRLADVIGARVNDRPSRQGAAIPDEDFAAAQGRLMAVIGEASASKR